MQTPSEAHVNSDVGSHASFSPPEHERKRTCLLIYAKNIFIIIIIINDAQIIVTLSRITSQGHVRVNSKNNETKCSRGQSELRQRQFEKPGGSGTTEVVAQVGARAAAT